jgi:hypothetical protein
MSKYIYFGNKISINIFYYAAASIEGKASDYKWVPFIINTFHQFSDICVSFSCLN